MANRRLPMRKTKEILRLKYACGLSGRGIALTRQSLVDREAVSFSTHLAEHYIAEHGQLERQTMAVSLPGNSNGLVPH